MVKKKNKYKDCSETKSKEKGHKSPQILEIWWLYYYFFPFFLQSNAKILTIKEYLQVILVSLTPRSHISFKLFKINSDNFATLAFSAASH